MTGSIERAYVVGALAGLFLSLGAAHAQTAASTDTALPESKQAPWRIYANHGQAELSAGNFSEADEEFTRALEKTPPKNERHAVYWARGSVRLQLQNHAGAIDDFTSALKLEEAAQIYLTRAMAYYALGQLEKTQDDASKALLLGLPAVNERARAYELRAYALMRQESRGAAISDFSSAIEINSAPHLHFHRANLFRAVGYENAAYADYQQVIGDERSPASMAAQSFLGLALIYHARRDVLNAMAAYDVFFSRLSGANDETRAQGAQMVQKLSDAGLYAGPALTYDAKLRNALTACVKDTKCKP